MKHYFVAAGVAWGHVRPLVALCIRLCRINPDLHITLLIQKFLSKKIEADRKRYDFDSVKDRFHIIEGGEDREEDLIGSEEYRKLILKFGDEAVNEYNSLVNGEQRVDALTGKNVTPWTTNPDAVILDTTLFGAMCTIPQSFEKGKPHPQMATFLPIASPPLVYNKSEHFVGIVNQVVGSRDRKAGYQKEYVVENDHINRQPSHHPFYQYELDPNVSTLNLYDFWSALGAAGPILEPSIAIMAWPSVLGPGRGAPPRAPPPGPKKAFSVGPQLPDDPTSTALENSKEEHSGQVKAFLDKWGKEKGDHSVIYISFGSLEFPPTKEHLWQFFDVLDELQIPYIMSQGNTPPDIVDLIPARIAKSGGRGLWVKWAPQVTILAHPATMGFMTHGGSNSAMEALLCGVPMIQWPHAWDQPMIANQMDYLGVAVELMQVRREHNIGRPTGRGVTVEGTVEAIHKEMKQTLQKLQGESGAAMREKARALGDEIRQDMSEGGAAYNDMKALASLSAVSS